MHDYIDRAVTTESLNYQQPNTRLLHATMGLVTETIELLGFNDDQNYLEELGDIMWYIALICDEEAFTLGEIEKMGSLPEQEDLVLQMVFDAGGLMDSLKKGTFYGKEQPVPYHLIGRIIGCVRICAVEAGFSLEQVMETNIAKLARRYSKGVFNEEEAVNRDVKKEMEAIR